MKSYLIKINVLIFTVFVFTMISLSLAGIARAASISDFRYSGDGSIKGKIDGEELTFKPYDRGLADFEGYYADSRNYNQSAKTGDYYILDVWKNNAESGRIHKLHADGTNSNYVWQNQLVTILPLSAGSSASTPFKSQLFPTLNCANNQLLSCWVNRVYLWSLGIIGTIAVVSLMAAGVMYMTSAGNTKQLDLAKTIMKNALSGVAIIVMAKFFLRILGAG